MRKDIIERVLTIADYVIATNDTVRGAAKAFVVSKSTVHKDLTERLTALDPKRADKIRAVLDRNLKERHVRGGEATKNKFKRK